jgi:hypothetical protein
MAFCPRRDSHPLNDQGLGDQGVKPLGWMFAGVRRQRNLDRGVFRQMHWGLGDKNAIFIDCGDGAWHGQASCGFALWTIYPLPLKIKILQRV